MPEQVTRMRTFHFSCTIRHTEDAERADEAYLRCWLWLKRKVNEENLDWTVEEEDGTTQEAPSPGRHLLPTLQLAYRKHVRDDDPIGWQELDELMLTALTEAMGDRGFQEWLATVRAEAQT